MERTGYLPRNRDPRTGITFRLSVSIAVFYPQFTSVTECFCSRSKSARKCMSVLPTVHHAASCADASSLIWDRQRPIDERIRFQWNNARYLLDLMSTSYLSRCIASAYMHHTRRNRSEDVCKQCPSSAALDRHSLARKLKRGFRYIQPGPGEGWVRQSWRCGEHAQSAVTPPCLWLLTCRIWYLLCVPFPGKVQV